MVLHTVNLGASRDGGSTNKFCVRLRGQTEQRQASTSRTTTSFMRSEKLNKLKHGGMHMQADQIEMHKVLG